MTRAIWWLRRDVRLSHYRGKKNVPDAMREEPSQHRASKKLATEHDRKES